MDQPSQAPHRESLKWSGRTDRGKVRTNNEDSFLALQFDAQEVRYLGRIGEASSENGDCIFAVSDGMGGMNAGEFASRIAVDKITRLMPASFKRSAMGLTADFEDTFTELYHEIHRALSYLGWSDPDCAGMGATLSMCWFTPGWMYFAHIGDSRIYYLPASDGGIKQLSQDDTYVGWQLRHGQISAWEARTHPGRNSLQKALGAGHQFVDPQVGAVGYEPGDIFMLCSDGLTDGLHEERILQLLRQPSEKEAAIEPAQRLVAASLEQSGQDNTTTLIIEIAP